MKVEIEYTIKEVTRFVVYKNVRGESENSVWWETNADGAFGEFQHREDAETVCDALEANIERKVRGAL